MKILHCNNTLKLARKISNEINLKIVNRSITKFGDGELNIQMRDDLYQQEVFIIHELYPNINENLVQLLFLINASKKMGAKRVHAIIPYLAYSRMDHKKQDNDFISSSCIASLLEAAGIDSLITIDLHSSQIEGFFRVPVKNISMFELFKKEFFSLKKENSVIVSPDIGGKIRSHNISKSSGMPIAVAYKQRDEENNVIMNGIMGSVEGKHCVIVDDIVASGQTIIKSIETLRKYSAKSIEVVATHNLIESNSQNLNVILKNVELFSISNSIQLNDITITLPKVRVVDICDPIVNCIKQYFKY